MTATSRYLNIGGKEKVLISERLPLDARLAFQGWRNFFQEGDAINALRITEAELQSFLTDYPMYRRSLWVNLLADQDIDYLSTHEALAPFLRTALYNWKLSPVSV